MILETNCPHCGLSIEFEANDSGQVVACPECAKNLELPPIDAPKVSKPTSGRIEAPGTNSYYFVLNDETKGPYTSGQLCSMWDAGAITGETLYCQEGYSDWLPLRRLQPVLEPPPPVATNPPVYIPSPSHKQRSVGWGVFWGLVGFFIILPIVGALVLVSIGVITESAISFSKAREGAQLNSIRNNLRIIEGAKDQWALENKKVTTDTVGLTDLTAYFKNNTTPAALAGEAYSLTTVAALAKATLPGSATLNGKPGPFTITSF